MGRNWRGDLAGLVPPGLSAAGGLLVGSMLAEFVVRAVGSPAMSLPFSAGVASSLPFAALLLGGGYHLSGARVSEQRYPRIVVWTVVSTGFFVSFFTIISMVFLESTWNQFAVIRWAVTVGAGGGFLTGFLNARSIEREVAAERAAVRAEEAEQRRELLEYLNSLLRHEVLNTANVIEGYAAALEREGRDDDSAAIIQRQAAELTSITSEVRLLLDATEEGTEMEPVDLVSLLHAEVRGLQDRPEPVETDVDLPDSAYVLADDLVRRLFSNLLENAVEHQQSPPASVSVAVDLDDDHVTVTIADDGPGIPPEKRESLFAATEGPGADHGLGLAIVGRLADRYDGRVELTETGPDGSVFTVELPRASVPEDDPAAIREADPQLQAP